MKQQPHRFFGTILGYTATAIGAITLGLWLLFDTENTITAISAAATIIIGVLIITLNRSPDTSNTS